ncbi:hypothetical protein [Actinosynnema mirum]|uniref:Capsid maturation protease n=1 Tax=Actinosynnema mirum (strain ATCC 29888 / DSM 43827 / JCM 3225 / NBRC 14064 / NCIMB 13271 / NRRL B-12336 / IMRU 3971 / 101) TaxID=446462 RepID=C6WC50_ACTMD|nr:hypothetical protein [Actinosynnema mirum]ACU39438.1 hypothetical protein Amir_5622 [Actinosynnema mirum DSM 43827]
MTSAGTAFYDESAVLERQAIAMILALWGRVDAANPSASWVGLLPEAVAILVAAQTVAAEMADPYLLDTLGGSIDTPVDPGGMVSTGLDALLYLPAANAQQALWTGMPAAAALGRARATLASYVRTASGDTGRLASAAGIAGRSDVAGYYRRLRLPSCSRCIVLAGRFYRWSSGFRRHKNCDCKHDPVQRRDDAEPLDVRGAIASGQVHGLSKAATAAIVEHGADPAQVINAQRGMYMIGDLQASAVGITRRAVAGARILARDVDRALGLDVRNRTYTNMTFDRAAAARYAELFRRGKTYVRTTADGRQQGYAYRYVRTPRPTPQQIVTSASSRAEAVRQLTNYGYIL